MNKAMTLGLLLGVFLSASAYAETVRGEIVEINQNNQYLRIRPADESMIRPESRILLSDETEYRGVLSLSDLDVGDQVEIEIDQDSAGVWQTQSIEPLVVTQPGSPQAQREGFGENESPLEREPVTEQQDGKYELETARETLLKEPASGKNAAAVPPSESMTEAQEGKYSLETARNTSLEESRQAAAPGRTGGPAEDSLTEQQEGKYGLETARNTSLEGNA